MGKEWVGPKSIEWKFMKSGKPLSQGTPVDERESAQNCATYWLWARLSGRALGLTSTATFFTSVWKPESNSREEFSFLFNNLPRGRLRAALLQRQVNGTSSRDPVWEVVTSKASTNARSCKILDSVVKIQMLGHSNLNSPYPSPHQVLKLYKALV